MTGLKPARSLTAIGHTALYLIVAMAALAVLEKQIDWVGALEGRFASPPAVRQAIVSPRPTITLLGAPPPQESWRQAVLYMTPYGQILVNDDAQGDGPGLDAYYIEHAEQMSEDDKIPSSEFLSPLVARAINSAGWAVGYTDFRRQGESQSVLPPRSRPSARQGAGPEAAASPALSGRSPGAPAKAVSTPGVKQACVRFAGSPGDLRGVRDIGTLPGYRDSVATALDDAGDVAGTALSPDGLRRRAFAWIGFRVHDLGTLGGSNSDGTAMAGSTIVGSSDTAAGDRHAFSVGFSPERTMPYQPASVTGRMLDLGTLGGRTSWANAVNQMGLVVGGSTRRDGRTHAFAYLPTSWYGRIQDGGRVYDVLYRQGMNDLPPLPGDDSSEAFAIGGTTDLDVVGVSYNSRGGPTRACMWEYGTVTDLNDLVDGPYKQKNASWVLHRAVGIDQMRDVIGCGSMNGRYMEFLLRLRQGGTGGQSGPAGLDVGSGNPAPRNYLAAPGSVPSPQSLLSRNARLVTVPYFGAMTMPARPQHRTDRP